MISWYIPNLDEDIIKEMLHTIGIQNIDDLFVDVSEDIKVKKPLNLPEPLSESQVKKIVREKLAKNKVHGEYRVFLGGGIYIHDIPSVISHIISRGEFLTAYTPYQPEVSQGILQSLFEYQSLVCELTGMDVANCSMYDYGTAAAEAILMSCRVTRRNSAIIASNISPWRKSVIMTYTAPKVSIKELSFDPKTGCINKHELESLLSSGEYSCLYLESPSFIGSIETNLNEISEIVHRYGSLLVLGTDLISLGLLKPPGDFDVDIVVSEGQYLGNPPNFGGPCLGILATKRDMRLIRQMPGRIVGMTTTKDGKSIAFVNILQTREQHIKRENATSNICTNEALTAVTAAIYLSLLGRQGLKKLAENLAYKSHYLAKNLRKLNLESPPYTSPFFRDLLIKLPDHISADTAIKTGLNKKLIIGINVSEYFPVYGNSILSSVYDVHTKEDLDSLISHFSELLRR